MTNNKLLSRLLRMKGFKVTWFAILEEHFLLPLVDHIDPQSDDLEFEISSWIVNEGKSQQMPEEYVALCEKVVKRRGRYLKSRIKD